MDIGHLLRQAPNFQNIGSLVRLGELKETNSNIGDRAAEAVREVEEGVVPWFREAAKQLLEEYSNPEEAMARALAKVTGHTKLQVKSRDCSFLPNSENADRACRLGHPFNKIHECDLAVHQSA